MVNSLPGYNNEISQILIDLINDHKTYNNILPDEVKDYLIEHIRLPIVRKINVAKGCHYYINFMKDLSNDEYEYLLSILKHEEEKNKDAIDIITAQRLSISNVIDPVELTLTFK